MSQKNVAMVKSKSKLDPDNLMRANKRDSNTGKPPMKRSAYTNFVSTGQTQKIESRYSSIPQPASSQPESQFNKAVENAWTTQKSKLSNLIDAKYQEWASHKREGSGGNASAFHHQMFKKEEERLRRN